MSTNIAVITQEESEPKLLPNANPTMALPFLDPLFVPQFPKKKLLQMKLWAKQDDAPLPLNLISSKLFLPTTVVPPKFRATNTTLLLPSPMATRKKTRLSNPKRRLDDQPNIQAFQKPKVTARKLFNWHTLCTSRS
jgi:hypothetical protein